MAHRDACSVEKQSGSLGEGRTETGGEGGSSGPHPKVREIPLGRGLLSRADI